jgi:hypothetical protein
MFPLPYVPAHGHFRDFPLRRQLGHDALPDAMRGVALLARRHAVGF